MSRSQGAERERESQEEEPASQEGGEWAPWLQSIDTMRKEMGRILHDSLSGSSPGQKEAWRALCEPKLPISRMDLRPPWRVIPEE